MILDIWANNLVSRSCEHGYDKLHWQTEDRSTLA